MNPTYFKRSSYAPFMQRERKVRGTVRGTFLFRMLTLALSVFLFGSVGSASVQCTDLFTPNQSSASSQVQANKFSFHNLTARLRDRLKVTSKDTSAQAQKDSSWSTDPRIVAGIQRMLYAHLKEGQTSYDAIDRFAEEILKTSPETQSLYVRETLKVYRSLSKRAQITQHLPTLSPRRLADRLLFQLVRGDQMISTMIREGQSTREAFKSYVDLINQHSSDRYHAEQVFEVAREIQKLMRELPNELAVDHIMMGGSFVNGRASLKSSDIDLSGERAELADFFKKPSVQEKLNSILRSHGTDAELRVEFHKLSEHFFGLSQPVSLKITADAIFIHLYAPADKSEVHFYRLSPVGFHPVEVHRLD